jgi:bisphosphoglycerate-independent phosphoglycerate mutase (AlkP superfamily)
MERFPESVSTALERLRKETKRYVEIKVIRGRYCVFESTSRWDKEEAEEGHHIPGHGEG